MNLVYRYACAMMFGLCATFAQAQTITLTLKDGSFSVSGQLRSFDGEFYDLDTPLGPLMMSATTTDCIGGGCPDPNDFIPTIRVAGSAALGELLVPTLIESFATQKGWVLSAVARSSFEFDINLTRADGSVAAVFAISLSSTETGYAALTDHAADIIMARRAPIPAEVEALRGTYLGGSSDPYRLRVIGWENLRLYTSDKNDAAALTITQLGEMTAQAGAAWPSGDPVHLRGDIDSLIAMRQQLGQSGPPPPFDTGRDTDPGVLYVTPNLSLPLQHVSLAPTCGTLETSLQFSEDGHPLSAPIYLVTSAVRHPPIMREFLDYALSVPAQRVVSRAGYLSRTPSEAPLASENGLLVNAILNATSETALEDLQSAVRRLNGYGRLSLTFRFQEGSMTLDDVSQSNLDFAAALLQQTRYADRDIVFAGFSDGIGAADGNERLSLARARTVRNAIRTRMGETAPPLQNFAAHGFGETLPLACNDTDWGQDQNRRVEIWIR